MVVKKTIPLDLGAFVPMNTPETSPVVIKANLLGKGKILSYEIGFPAGAVTDIKATLEMVSNEQSRFSLPRFYGTRKYLMADDHYIKATREMEFNTGYHLELRVWNEDIDTDYEVNCTVTVEYYLEG